MNSQPARKQNKVTRYEMKNEPTDDEKYEMLEAAFRTLEAEGKIYNTGQRRWSERTQTYQVVWATVPKDKH
jgi:hypothetical protein